MPASAAVRHDSICRRIRRSCCSSHAEVIMGPGVSGLASRVALKASAASSALPWLNSNLPKAKGARASPDAATRLP